MKPSLLGVSIACLFAGASFTAALAQEGGVIIDQDRADRRPPSVDAPPAPARERGHVETPAAPFTPFVLQSIEVEGASLPPSAFDAAIASMRGDTIDAANLSQLADAISGVYAESDIALYTILVPPQDFANGHVRLQAIEGHVSNVALSGDTDGDITLARHYAAALTTERPLSRRTMEREMLLLSDIPGLKTDVRMAPAADAGGVVMGLGLQRRRFEYGFGINNSGSSSLGRTQLEASVSANGLARFGDQTRLSVSTDSQFERFTYVTLSHRQPLGHDGASVQARISALETDPPNGVSGQARAAGVVFVYPAIRSYQRNLTLSLGIDGLNSDNAFLGDTIASERTRVARGSAVFSDGRRNRSYSAAATASFGMDDFGARTSTPGTDLDFTKLNLQAAYNRNLGPSWAVRLAGAAQASSDALPASERMALGGARFGRAFESAEVAGDYGAAASAELAWRAARREGLSLSEIYTFTDGGQVWTVDRPLSAGYSRDLISAGIGTRIRANAQSTLELEAVKSIDEPLPGVEERGWGLRFGMNARF